jgi:PPIC-type PPIASE domain
MPRPSWIVGVLVVLLVGASFWYSKGAPRVPEEPGARATSVPVSSPIVPSAAPAPAGSAWSAPLVDGRGVPELPAGAPKNVSFGVVLLAYRGAELAPSDARPKEAALAMAKDLIDGARKNFADAVKKGDRGSTSEAGTMPRGVLEPNVEYVLFTLKRGEVYGDPVDTPRGYWILRRND